jgi:hypothetical protein
MDEVQALANQGSNGGGRKPKTRVTVPIGPTETIRNRLQLNEGQMSEALGYAPGAYSGFKRNDKLPKTAALAAEALMRRQAANGDADQFLMVCVIKGAPLIFDVTEDIREMRLDGTTYYLLPKTAAQGQP